MSISVLTVNHWSCSVSFTPWRSVIFQELFKLCSHSVQIHSKSQLKRDLYEYSLSYQVTQTVSILTFFFAFAAAHDYFVFYRDQMEVLEIWWNLAEIARHFFLGSFGSFF